MINAVISMNCETGQYRTIQAATDYADSFNPLVPGSNPGGVTTTKAYNHAETGLIQLRLSGVSFAADDKTDDKTLTDRHTRRQKPRAFILSTYMYPRLSELCELCERAARKPAWLQAFRIAHLGEFRQLLSEVSEWCHKKQCIMATRAPPSILNCERFQQKKPRAEGESAGATAPLKGSGHMHRLSESDVLAMARDLWLNQHNLTLDQIDGSFYWRVCRWQEISTMLREAENRARAGQIHHAQLGMQLKQLIPNAGEVVFWGTEDLIPAYPDMFGAIDMKRTNHLSHTAVRATGGFDTGGPLRGYAWTQVGIRNADWSGDQVEAALREYHRFHTQYSPLIVKNVPYPPDESIVMIGAKLYRDGEYKQRLYWNPENENPEEPNHSYAEVEQFFSETGRDSVYDYELDTANWHTYPWGAMVAITVADPLPPPGIIAAYYDAFVISQSEWNLLLSGASNGQDVATAIRTWAIGLLAFAGITYRDASRKVSEALEGSIEVSDTKFRADRQRLINRVPESELWLRRNRNT